MGATIEWVMERQHRDNTWSAVASKSQMIADLGPTAYAHLPFQDPRFQISEQNYLLFSILSNIRADPFPNREPLAHHGLPEDASAYATEYLGEVEDIFDWFHTHGYFTLKRLQNAVHFRNKRILPLDKHQKAAEAYLGAIQRVLAGPEAVDLSLVLPEGAADISRCRMLDQYKYDESNHQRIERLARSGSLKPIDPETLRFVIAYSS
jgi:hypothetical protein